MHVCVFAPLWATYDMPSFKIFILWVHLTRSLGARTWIFDIFIIIFFFKFKWSILCGVFFSFILNWLFYTLNSIYLLDFLTVSAADISTSNKKKLKIDAMDFLKLIFESSATYILQCETSRVPSLPYHWQNLFEKKMLWVLLDPLARVTSAGQSISLSPHPTPCSLKENKCFGLIDCLKT